MVLSLRRGLLFLCTPKCASTALSELLLPYGDVVLTGLPALKHLGWRDFQSHFATLVKEHLPADRKLVSFALMRDPLEWAGSWYRYRARPFLAQQDNHPHYTGDMSFERFIRGTLEDQPPPFAAIGRQSTVFCDDRGQVAVDYLFPLAAMDRVVAFLEERLGEPVTVRRRNRSMAQAAMALDAGLVRAFRQRYAREFEIYHSLDLPG